MNVNIFTRKHHIACTSIPITLLITQGYTKKNSVTFQLKPENYKQNVDSEH